MPAIHFHDPELKVERIRQSGGAWAFDLIVTDRPGYGPPESVKLVLWFDDETAARSMAARLFAEPHVQAHEEAA